MSASASATAVPLSRSALVRLSLRLGQLIFQIADFQIGQQVTGLHLIVALHLDVAHEAIGAEEQILLIDRRDAAREFQRLRHRPALHGVRRLLRPRRASAAAWASASASDALAAARREQEQQQETESTSKDSSEMMTSHSSNDQPSPAIALL